LRAYVLIAVLAGGLFALPASGVDSIPVNLVLSAIAAIAVMRLNANLLNLDEMFPEVLQLPGVRWLLGRPALVPAGGKDG
jgi:hypothetical protein